MGGKTGAISCQRITSDFCPGLLIGYSQLTYISRGQSFPYPQPGDPLDGSLSSPTPKTNIQLIIITKQLLLINNY